MPVPITLHGAAYTLEPGFNALCRIEEELGTGLVTLASRLANEGITLKEMSVIIYHCLAVPTPRHVVETALVDGNMAQATQAIISLMSAVFGAAENNAISPEELSALQATFSDSTDTASPAS